MKTQYFSHLFWLVGLMVGLGMMLSSCEDCTFTSNNTTTLVISFHLKNASGRLDSVVQQFQSVKTSVGTPLFSRFGSQASYRLRLNPSADTSTFFFETRLPNNSLKIDTLIIGYKRQISLVSPDCGYDEAITQLRVRKSTFVFDSVAISHPELTIITDDSHIKFIRKK